MDDLKIAVYNYDVRYLSRLANGEDPEAPEKGMFDVEGGKMFWTKSKLGDFKKIGDTDSASKKEGRELKIKNESVKRSSTFQVKYQTFDEEQSAKNQGTLSRFTESDSMKTENSIKTQNSKWAHLKRNTSEAKKNRPETPIITKIITVNVFSEDDFEVDSSGNNKKESSGDDFEKVSPHREEKTKSDEDTKGKK